MDVCQPYAIEAFDKPLDAPLTIDGALAWARLILERAIPRHRKQKPSAPQAAPIVRLVGYARVSTADQSLEMQKDALRKAGVRDDNLFVETVSGVSKRRPCLELALKDARQGDTFVVWKLDRLGRSLRDLLNRIDALEKRGIGFRSLTENIDTTTITGRLLLNILGSLAQFERELITERSRAGMEAHIARGGRVGRKQVLSEKQKAQGRKWIAKGMSVADVAKRLGVTPQTVYVRVKGRPPAKPKQER